MVADVDGRTDGRPRLGTYRVEYRAPGETSVLAEADECFPHHASLTPYLSYLRRLGRAIGGELVLVNGANGAVVARRMLHAEGSGVAS